MGRYVIVRIEVVDPGGNGVGLAIGLLELGHRVRYVPAREGTVVGRMERMRLELVDRMFGGGDAFAGEPELLVLVDVFADHLHCLEQRAGDVGTAEPRDPLQADAGVLIYPKRLEYFCERALRAENVAVVDLSDRGGPREPAFEGMPHVRRFAREVGDGDERGRWQPFPFLFNTTMLWLEYTCPQEQWWVENRSQSWDWGFCGTIDHERYGGYRRRRIEELAARWPHLRGAVLVRRPFLDVLGALQSVRFGLDLRGAGELCFRMHECLALGVPVWRPDAGRVQLPGGLSDLVFTDPQEAPQMSPAEVRAGYLCHYGPMAAARWLLDGVQKPISCATSIAPAASR